MNHIEYQKYIFWPKSSNLKNGLNGAGAYSIPRSVSYGIDKGSRGNKSLACMGLKPLERVVLGLSRLLIQEVPMGPYNCNAIKQAFTKIICETFGQFHKVNA